MEEHQEWRLQLTPDVRYGITKSISKTLEQHLSFSCSKRPPQLMKIAESFEGKIYTAADSLSDYLFKMSLKMLIIQTTSSHNRLPSITSNPVDMDDTRWQNHFQVGSRWRIFSKILDTSLKYLPVCGLEEFLEDVKFEESVFTTATDESDYLHKISLNILSVEVNSENSNVNL